MYISDSMVLGSERLCTSLDGVLHRESILDGVYVMSLRFPSFQKSQVSRSDIQLILQQGRDRCLLVTARDQNGDLVDVSEASDITYEIADQPRETPLVSYSLADDNIGITSDTGFRVDIDALDLKDLCGIYYHDAKVLMGDGKRFSVLLGPIWIQSTIVEVPE